MNNNPYRHDQVNINLFYGRNSLKDELLSKLRNGQSFGITGGRRIGKTTLLRKVEADLTKGIGNWSQGGLLVIPVYLDILSLPHPITQEAIFDFILSKVKSKMVDYIKHGDTSNSDQIVNIPYHPFAAELAHVLAQVREYRVQVIVLIDEVEPILANQWGAAFFANWRSFLHNEPAITPYLSAVFTGASEMFRLTRDIGSPLGNVLTWRELTSFSFDDTALLVNEPTGYYLPKEFSRKVYSETGGHPFLVQYTMNHVCNHDLELADISLSQAIQTFFDCERDKFERWWEQLPAFSQQIYAYLVQAKTAVKRQDLIKAFSNVDANKGVSILCHTGITSYLPEQDEYIASGLMFEHWFLEYARLDVTDDLAEQVDRLLKGVERSMRKLLHNHLEKKYGSDWLDKCIAKIPKSRDGALTLLDSWSRNAKRPLGTLGTEEALFYAEFGDLFSIVVREWGELKQSFKFSKDANKNKLLFEERQDLLVSVRNALRHVRENTISAVELLKAQAFCMEILEQIDGPENG